MKFLKLQISANSLFLFLLAFCLVSTSLSVIPSSMAFYAVAFILIFIYEIKTMLSNRNFLLKGPVRALVLLFFVSMLITNTINQTFDYRFFLFLLVILLTSPLLTNGKLFLFKGKLIRFICIVFALVTFISFFCYCIGYNGPIDLDANYNPLDFKGITNHPMWLAPMCGITNIFILNSIYETESKYKKFFLFALLAISIYLGVVAASRSALLASCVAMIFMFYMKAKNVIRFVRILIFVCVLAVISIPYMDTERMEGKMETQKENNGTSRDGLWKQRAEEFEDSPLFGVGFATSGVGKNKKTGRLESGSGWFAVATQTGLFGFICVLCIASQARIKKQWLKLNDNLLFCTSLLLFLCIHSFFEGYIYTPGYNLCLLFWLLIGFLTEAKQRLSLKLCK